MKMSLLESSAVALNGCLFDETSAGIRYQEPSATVPRTWLALCALLGLAACVGLAALVRGGGSVVAWLALSGLLALVLLFAYVALAGASQALVFDRERCVLHGRVRRGFGLVRTLQAGFDDVRRIEVRRCETDSAIFYDITLALPRGAPVALGAFDRREDAEQWAARLTQLLQRP
jgi:predicted membrane-bound mannosyltransferase